MPKYEILIGGYGCEVCWYKLTEEQYNYWNSVDKEILDRHVLGRGIFNDEEDDIDKDLLNNMPEYADLRKKGELEWYDLHDAGREYYCTLDNSWIHVRLLDEHSVNNAEIIISRDLKELENVYNNSDNTSENNENIIVYNNTDEYISHPYILQIVSYEKGTFFAGIIETDDNNNETFDITKLRINVSESLNESDTRIDSIEYNGIDIHNEGAETSGKGIDIFLYEF